MQAQKSVNVGINLGVTKESVQTLIQDLKKIQQAAQQASEKNLLTDDLKESAKEAEKLTKILSSGWNKSLQKMDLTKVQKSLQKTYKNADLTQKAFARMGSTGLNVYKQIYQVTSGTNLQLRKSSEILDKMAITMANTIRFGISSRIFNNLANSIDKAWDFTKGLDKSLNNIRIVTQKSSDEMAIFAKNANRAAKELGASTRDYTEASLIYYQQGLQDQEVQARTNVTLKTANVTKQNADDVSEQLTAVWNGYKVNAAETELYIDKLAAVAASTASDLEELSTGMSKVASAANMMGVDIDQLNAQLATIVSVTREAPESIGVALKTIYARINDIKIGESGEATLGEYSSRMSSLGVEVLDLNGELRDTGEVIEEVMSKWDTMSREQQVALAKTMAGTRQYNKLLALFENKDLYQKSLAISQQSAGELQKENEIYLESLEAHLEQLKTEAERTYDAIFDEESIRNFIDILNYGLKNLNDVIVGLGGGFNSLLNIGSQIAVLFNKQIADGIIRVTTNLHNYVAEQKQLKENFDTIKNRVVYGHAAEGYDIKSTYADEEANVVKTMLEHKKGFSKTEFNDIANIAKEKAQLKQDFDDNLRKSLNEKTYNEMRKEQDMPTALKKLNDLQEKRNTLFEEYKDILGSIKEIEKQGIIQKSNNPDEQSVYEAQQNQIQELIQSLRDLRAEKVLTDTNFNDKGAFERTLTGLEAQSIELPDDVDREIIGKAIKETTYDSSRKYNRQKNYVQALKLEEEEKTKIEEGIKKDRIAKGVQTTTAAVEGITAITGAMKVLTDDTAKGADQANAAWQGVFGTGSAIANAIMPGSGFIIQGIGQVLKNILDITGLWEKIENSFKSSKELLDEANQELAEIKQEQSNSMAKNQDILKAEEYFKENEERFKKLQELANKGLLTKDLQNDYNVYLQKVQQYNKEAEISYDKQGNLLTLNNNIISDTLEKMQEMKKLELEKTYSEKNWKKTNKAYNKQVKAREKEKREKDNEYQNQIDDFNVDFINKNIHAIGNPQDNIQNKNALERIQRDIQRKYPTTEDQIENIEQIESQIKQNINSGLYTGHTVNRGDKGDKELYLKYLNEYAKKIKNIQTQVDNQNIIKPSLDPGAIENFAKYGEDKEKYISLSQIFKDKDNYLNNIIHNFINSNKDKEKYLKKNGADKFLEDILDYEDTLITIFSNGKTFNIYENFVEIMESSKDKSAEEYKTELLTQVKSFLSQLTKEQYDIIKPYLKNIFGLESISTEWDTDLGAVIKDENKFITAGDKVAKSIGELLSQQLDSEEAKKPFKQGIEKMLKDSFTEVELSNIGSEDFVKRFNENLLNQAGDTLDLQKAFDKTKDSYNNTVEGSIVTASQTLKDQNLDANKIKDYAKYLKSIATESDEIGDSVAKDSDEAVELARNISRMNRGLNTLTKNFDKWHKILKNNANKTLPEYADALTEMRAAVRDLFDISDTVDDSVLNDFIVSHQEAFQQIINGDLSNLDNLKFQFAEKMLESFDLDDTTEQQILKNFKSLKIELENLDIKPGESIKSQSFIDKCNMIIKAAHMTKDQANDFFKLIHFKPVYKEDTVKQKRTTAVIHTVTIPRFKKVEGPDGKKHWGFESTQYSYGTKGKEIEENQIPIGAIGTEEEPVSPEIIGGSSTGNINNLGSITPPRTPSGGGGSSFTPVEKQEDDRDRYHDVNIKLKQTSNKLTNVQAEQKKLSNNNVIPNLIRQYELLNQQITLTAEKIKIAKQEMAELQNKLANKGAIFNKDGSISNYNDLYQHQLNSLNSTIEKYNNMSEKRRKGYKSTLDQAQKRFKEFTQELSRYDKILTDEIPNLEKDIQKAKNEQIEKQLQAFHMEIEIRLNMAEAERDWNKFKKEVIDDIKNTDILGSTKASLKDISSYYKEAEKGVIQVGTKHLQDILKELQILDSGKESNFYGDDRKKAIEDLEKYYKQLKDNLTEVHNLSKEIQKSYLDMMDQIQEKFDEQISNFELINDLIEHDKNLINLLYGEESYDQMSNFYNKQQENYKSQIDFQRKEVELWKERMDAEEEGSEAWKKAKENWTSAVSDLNSLIENSIQNLQDSYLNTINKIFKDLNNKITNNMGLDYVESQWDLINKNADQYLDNMNAIYSVQSLQNKYLDAIEKAQNPAHQKRLNDLMDKELKQLREQDKLTQHDIDRAELKYQLVLRQIALEEAQKNKTSLRLRRDSQGNYTYQYTADQDQIAGLQQEISDLYNQLYNLDANAYKENLNQLYSVWNDFQQAMAEAAQINDPEKRAEKELLIRQQYGEIINNIVADNEQLQSELYQSTMSHLMDLYNQNVDNYGMMADEQKDILDQFITEEMDTSQVAFDNMFNLHNATVDSFRNMTETEKDIIISSMIPQWNSGIQTMIDTIAAEGGFNEICKDSFNQLDKATQDYATELENIEQVAQEDFEKVTEGIDTTINATEDLIHDNDTLIDSYNDELDAIKLVIAELDTLIKKYNDAAAAARKATEDAYRYWQEQNRKNANEAANHSDIKAEAEKNKPALAPAPKPTPAPTPAPKPSSPQGNGRVDIGDQVTLNGKVATSSSNRPNVWSKYTGKKVYIQMIHSGNSPYHVGISPQYSSRTAIGWTSLSQISGYDTGGYTGTWNNMNGRLGFLHQKELVLNAKDTKNILDTVEIVRNITNSLGETLLSKIASISTGNANFMHDMSKSSNDIKQNVIINADFPNAENAQEIENALNNLVNKASQYIQK